jgi:hypothetical protein
MNGQNKHRRNPHAAALGRLGGLASKGVTSFRKKDRRVGTVYWVEGRKGVAIKLTREKHALVDYEDAEYLLQFNWTAKTVKGSLWYAERWIPSGAGVKMHCEIMGHTGIDHRNRNGLDNRRSNLRDATVMQNQWNIAAFRTNTSGFKGVYRASKNRWYAMIMKHGKQNYLGMFKTPEEAAVVRDEASKRLHGEFAFLNFPDPLSDAGVPKMARLSK